MRVWVANLCIGVELEVFRADLGFPAAVPIRSQRICTGMITEEGGRGNVDFVLGGEGEGEEEG